MDISRFKNKDSNLDTCYKLSKSIDSKYISNDIFNFIKDQKIYIEININGKLDINTFQDIFINKVNEYGSSCSLISDISKYNNDIIVNNAYAKGDYKFYIISIRNNYNKLIKDSNRYHDIGVEIFISQYSVESTVHFVFNSCMFDFQSATLFINNVIYDLNNYINYNLSNDLLKKYHKIHKIQEINNFNKNINTHRFVKIPKCYDNDNDNAYSRNFNDIVKNVIIDQEIMHVHDSISIDITSLHNMIIENISTTSISYENIYTAIFATTFRHYTYSPLFNFQIIKRISSSDNILGNFMDVCVLDYHNDSLNLIEFINDIKEKSNKMPVLSYNESFPSIAFINVEGDVNIQCYSHNHYSNLFEMQIYLHKDKTILFINIFNKDMPSIEIYKNKFIGYLSTLNESDKLPDSFSYLDNYFNKSCKDIFNKIDALHEYHDMKSLNDTISDIYICKMIESFNNHDLITHYKNTDQYVIGDVYDVLQAYKGSIHKNILFNIVLFLESKGIFEYIESKAYYLVHMKRVKNIELLKMKLINLLTSKSEAYKLLSFAINQIDSIFLKNVSAFSLLNNNNLLHNNSLHSFNSFDKNISELIYKILNVSLHILSKSDSETRIAEFNPNINIASKYITSYLHDNDGKKYIKINGLKYNILLDCYTSNIFASQISKSHKSFNTFGYSSIPNKINNNIKYDIVILNQHLRGNKNINESFIDACNMTENDGWIFIFDYLDHSICNSFNIMNLMKMDDFISDERIEYDKSTARYNLNIKYKLLDKFVSNFKCINISSIDKIMNDVGIYFKIIFFQRHIFDNLISNISFNKLSFNYNDIFKYPKEITSNNGIFALECNKYFTLDDNSFMKGFIEIGGNEEIANKILDSINVNEYYKNDIKYMMLNDFQIGYIEYYLLSEINCFSYDLNKNISKYEQYGLSIHKNINNNDSSLNIFIHNEISINEHNSSIESSANHDYIIIKIDNHEKWYQEFYQMPYKNVISTYADIIYDVASLKSAINFISNDITSFFAINIANYFMDKYKISSELHISKWTGIADARGMVFKRLYFEYLNYLNSDKYDKSIEDQYLNIINYGIKLSSDYRMHDYNIDQKISSNLVSEIFDIKYYSDEDVNNDKNDYIANISKKLSIDYEIALQRYKIHSLFMRWNDERLYLRNLCKIKFIQDLNNDYSEDYKKRFMNSSVFKKLIRK